MELIDKAALVAEIEKLIDEIYAGRPFDSLSSEQQIALWYVKSIMSSIITLEVKEVDLEKELNDFIEQQKAWIKDDRVVEYDNGDSFNHIYDLEKIAKHFFELGMSVGNKAQKGE